MVEAVRIGVDPAAADQPVGRLQPDDPAQCRRAADRAAGVGAERRRDEPGRDRRSRPARRAAGEMVAVPRVARRRPGQVEARAAMGELMGGELAGQNRAGVVELAHRCRIGGRHGADTGFGMPGGADAGGRIDVLEAERNAVHRPAIAAGRDLPLGGASLVEGAIKGRQQIGVELRIERFCPADQRLGQLDRRQFLPFDPPRSLGDGHESQFGRWCRHVVGHREISFKIVQFSPERRPRAARPPCAARSAGQRVPIFWPLRQTRAETPPRPRCPSPCRPLAAPR